MKIACWLSLGGMLILAGCAEEKVAHYATYADAVADGAIERGWMPAFVPVDAKSISEKHDVDADHVAVTFLASSKDFMSLFRAVPDLYSRDAEDTFSSIDFSVSPVGGEVFYYHCIEDGAGLLARAPNSQRFFYFEPLKDGAWEVLCEEGALLTAPRMQSGA